MSVQIRSVANQSLHLYFMLCLQHVHLYILNKYNHEHITMVTHLITLNGHDLGINPIDM